MAANLSDKPSLTFYQHSFISTLANLFTIYLISTLRPDVVTMPKQRHNAVLTPFTG